ncbi:carboxymuconolactone decarboxylase family protein [Pseudodesulfovibrio indicus]|uniref:4-carboxymuconolactone decarboxylase n=1 Tax=Pseudodesulfovibrio indicus TaxID=1716143 RepID=A0A126QLY5_9BACT|nr:carboxymuconolactone decarboxylase family protein [Pseudodesulfovibrio indicus]AMK10816.1 4-carboxymuconolactone decarboxylase [Pseudodesulfovibrio indicus]TDT91809.1 4-carboxymuconolactone decarboxylase [Pseudodesulfovibrio indicus]
MDNERFERGMEMLREVDGQLGDRVVESLSDVAPDLARLMVEFAFGDVYVRPALNLRDRELVTIAALAAKGGCEPQLKVHVNGALNVGLTRDEIVETFLQIAVYAGFPAALNAVFAAKAVFAERDG